jgi:hypothetical protein
VRVVELSDHPGGQLDRGRRAEVLRLIEHDHAFHDKRRRARSR